MRNFIGDAVRHPRVEESANRRPATPPDVEARRAQPRSGPLGKKAIA